MMKYILLLVMLLSTSAQAEIDCSRHKIFCHIKQLRPDMTKKKAMELSNIIYKYSKEYGTDPAISVAIGMQESGLRSIHRSVTGLMPVENCGNEQEGEMLCVQKLEEKRIYTDFGMFQFHHRSIKWYKLNFDLIYIHDLDYIVKSHVQILKQKIRGCKELKQKAWSCYHSTTPTKRNLYLLLVERYLPKQKKEQP